jgi:hypothetical protein
MATTAGDEVLDGNGDVKLDANGDELLGDGADCTNCPCGGGGGGDCFFLARRCADDVLTGWSTPCPLTSTYVRKTSNGACYYFADPSQEEPGTDIGAVTAVTDCADATCSDEVPPDDVLPPDDHVPFVTCPPNPAACLDYPTVTLTAGGTFNCPDIYDVTTEGTWDGKMTGDGLCNWGAAPTQGFGGKLMFDAGVTCQPKGSAGFETQGGWLLNVTMYGATSLWSYDYRKFGGSTPAGAYDLWKTGGSTGGGCEDVYGGSPPSTMSIG